MSAAPSRSSAARGRIFYFRPRKVGGASTSPTCRLLSALRMGCALLAICCATISFARDSGQWEDTDPELRVWYQALRQPDNPQASCCGLADAYYCDKVWSKD